MDLSGILGYALIAVVSAFPLYLAATLLGGDTGLLKAILVNLGCGLVLVLIRSYLGIDAAIVAFLAVILVYKIMFSLGWLRAFLVLLLQGIIILLLAFVAPLLGVRFIGMGHSFFG